MNIILCNIKITIIIFSTIILFVYGQYSAVFGDEIDNGTMSFSIRTIADTRVDDIIIKAAKNSTSDVYVDDKLVAKWMFSSCFINETMLDEYIVEKMIKGKKHILVLYNPNDICQNNVRSIYAISKGNGYHDIEIFFKEKYLNNFFEDHKNENGKYGVVFDDCLTELFHGSPPVESGFLIKGNFGHQFLQIFLERDISVILIAAENPFPTISVEYIFIPFLSFIIYISSYLIFFRKHFSLWFVCFCFIVSCVCGYILGYKCYDHIDDTSINPIVVHKFDFTMSVLGIILGGLFAFLIVILFKRFAKKRTT